MSSRCRNKIVRANNKEQKLKQKTVFLTPNLASEKYD